VVSSLSLSLSLFLSLSLCLSQRPILHLTPFLLAKGAVEIFEDPASLSSAALFACGANFVSSFASLAHFDFERKIEIGIE
jgi:hypothetical protein